jgi:hypothetical protein
VRAIRNPFCDAWSGRPAYLAPGHRLWRRPSVGGRLASETAGAVDLFAARPCTFRRQIAKGHARFECRCPFADAMERARYHASQISSLLQLYLGRFNKMQNNDDPSSRPNSRKIAQYKHRREANNSE